MAQFLTKTQAREFEIDGKTYDLIALVQALNSTPDGWVSPASVSELELGQIVHVWALGDRLRRGVVAKLGRTKAVVAFTTQGSVDEAARYGKGEAAVRIADTAVQLSQIKIPAPAAPVQGEPVEETPAPAEGDEMSTETQTAPAPPTAENTGSAVVQLLEKVWARIREDHPELPQVVMITGSGLIGSNKWGHFRADGWKVREEGAAVSTQMHEMFMAGETLAEGARRVVQTMLHEGAHTLARVRNLKDTSRQGRWHNQTFRKLAEEMGLEHKRASADAQHGFSFVTLTETTAAKYADLMAELDREIRLVVDLPWFIQRTKTGGDEDETEGGELIRKRERKTGGTPQSGNLKATCSCPEPNIIRASRKVLDLGVIRCDECEELFTA